jgi:hypothetical protein
MAANMGFSADTPKLRKELSGLQKFVGKWETVLPGKDGKSQTFTVEIEPVDNGNAAVIRGTAPGLWYFDPETRKVNSIQIGDGVVQKRSIAPEDLNKKEITSFMSYVTRDNKPGVVIEKITWVNEDTHILSSVDEYEAGKKVTPTPPSTWKRVPSGH